MITEEYFEILKKRMLDYNISEMICNGMYLSNKNGIIDIMSVDERRKQLKKEKNG